MLNGDLVLDIDVLTNTTLCSVDHVKRKISKYNTNRATTHFPIAIKFNTNIVLMSELQRDY